MCLYVVLTSRCVHTRECVNAAGNSSSRRPSGSRVGSATAGEALRAFTCLVTTTLGDSHAQQHAVAEQALSAHLSAEEALNALQKLALQQQEPAAGPAEEAAGEGTVIVSQYVASLLAWLPLVHGDHTWVIPDVSSEHTLSACPRHLGAVCECALLTSRTAWQCTADHLSRLAKCQNVK